jgi:hypothetical protein
LLFEGPRGHALDAGARVYVPDDNSSGGDDGPCPDLEAVGDDGSHPDHRARSDPDVAGDVRAGIERGGGRDRNVVTDERAAADEDVRA